jgi:hypothetical protein
MGLNVYYIGGAYDKYSNGKCIYNLIKGTHLQCLNRYI